MKFKKQKGKLLTQREEGISSKVTTLTIIDLRLRSIKSQQENLKEVISKEIEDHQHLLT